MSQMKQEILDQVSVLLNNYDLYSKRIMNSSKNFINRDIFLIGTGASLNACMQAKYAFLKYMKRNINVLPACNIEYYKDILERNSLVILVSQSGESYETKIVCDILKDKGVPFYGITNNNESYLAKSSDYVFLCNAGKEVSSATKTHTASMMILYMIASCINKDGMNQIGKIPEFVEKTIDMAEVYVNELCDFIGDSNVLYLLGKGAHFGTSAQAALLFKEKDFINAEGISLAEFRHGPVETIKSGTKIIIVSSGEANFINCLQHGKFLRDVCKADVVMVSDYKCSNNGGFKNYGFRWGMDEELSHICATIPFQLVAENIASMRGYNVDGFKFIGKVLNNY